jgi:hypothetical protein
LTCSKTGRTLSLIISSRHRHSCHMVTYIMHAMEAGPTHIGGISLVTRPLPPGRGSNASNPSKRASTCKLKPGSFFQEQFSRICISFFSFLHLQKGVLSLEAGLNRDVLRIFVSCFHTLYLTVTVPVGWLCRVAHECLAFQRVLTDQKRNMCWPIM